jgi:hypothetical protein
LRENTWSNNLHIVRPKIIDRKEDARKELLESENEEEKDFYEMIGDYLLQKRQKEVIEGNLF